MYMLICAIEILKTLLTHNNINNIAQSTNWGYLPDLIGI